MCHEDGPGARRPAAYASERRRPVANLPAHGRSAQPACTPVLVRLQDGPRLGAQPRIVRAAMRRSPWAPALLEVFAERRPAPIYKERGPWKAPFTLGASPARSTTGSIEPVESFTPHSSSASSTPAARRGGCGREGDRGLQALAEGRTRHTGGEARRASRPTAGPARPVQAVLPVRDRGRRRLADLVAPHGGHVHALVLGEDVRTGPHRSGPVVDHSCLRERSNGRFPLLRARAGRQTCGRSPAASRVAAPRADPGRAEAKSSARVAAPSPCNRHRRRGRAGDQALHGRAFRSGPGAPTRAARCARSRAATATPSRLAGRESGDGSARLEQTSPRSGRLQPTPAAAGTTHRRSSRAAGRARRTPSRRRPPRAARRYPVRSSLITLNGGTEEMCIRSPQLVCARSSPDHPNRDSSHPFPLTSSATRRFILERSDQAAKGDGRSVWRHSRGSWSPAPH
jgi:hypothetical protein